MATVTAVGPATILDGPLPVPPLHALLETPGVLVEEASAGDRPRWLNGAGVWGFPSDVPSAWEPCSQESSRTKSDTSTQPQVMVDPFGIYLPIVCSSLGMTDDFDERAAIALRATQSYGVERALAGGVTGSANAFFGDPNMDILAAGAAVSAVNGIAYLENAIAASGRRGMIHIAPPVAVKLDGIPLGGDGITGPLLTPSGNSIVVGAGYSGLDPAGAAPAPGPTESWAYATGPVEVRLSEVMVIPQDIGDALDTSTNEVVYRAERFVLAVWDGAVQAGVRIGWTL